ncbi:MAG: hypothetical protein ACJAVK_001060 [Akkermansiaceae bacterium]|jgi:hypothetical protein
MEERDITSFQKTSTPILTSRDNFDEMSKFIAKVGGIKNGRSDLGPDGGMKAFPESINCDLHRRHSHLELLSHFQLRPFEAPRDLVRKFFKALSRKLRKLPLSGLGFPSPFVRTDSKKV